MGSDDSATSRFEELKQQYEETGGFADEGTTETTAEAETPADTPSEEPTASPADLPAESTTGADEEDVSVTEADSVGTETTVPDKPPVGTGAQSTPAPSMAGGQAGGRPYLEPIPAGYWAERRVIEWLEFLVATGGTDGAGDAIDFYRSVGWIGPRAETRLKEYLTIFPKTATGQSMSYDDHRQSLEYIASLCGHPQRW